MPKLPEPVRDLYETKTGFSNYHFSRLQRDRVTAALRASVGDENLRGVWEIDGTLEDGRPFRIELSDVLATIDLPTGTSRLDPREALDKSPVPPGSGGMLAALVVWRKLLLDGPETVGRTDAVGTAPVSPDLLPVKAETSLADLLRTDVGGVSAETFVAMDGGPTAGRVVGVDLWASPQADPCEVRFERDPAEASRPAWMPTVIEVHSGSTRFGRFSIRSFQVRPADSDATSTEEPAS